MILPIAVMGTTFAYIGIALIAGPRRVSTGAELPILIGVSVLLLVMLSRRPRFALYSAGILAIASALAVRQRALPGFAGWEVELLFPMGWTLVGSSVWSWRRSAALYVAAGLWALALVAWPEGIAYFDGPLHDADQLVYNVLVPIAFWPYVTFGMLGVFGVRFV